MKASRLFRKAASGVLGRTPPCNVPRGYASVDVFPAALLTAFLNSLLGVYRVPRLSRRAGLVLRGEQMTNP